MAEQNYGPYLSAIQSLPKDRWLGISEIFQLLTNGHHTPALVHQLCCMDDGKHYHDGYLFEGSQGRVRFRWTKQASAPESEAAHE